MSEPRPSPDPSRLAELLLVLARWVHDGAGDAGWRRAWEETARSRVRKRRVEGGIRGEISAAAGELRDALLERMRPGHGRSADPRERGWTTMLGRDVRFASRMFLRNPGSTAAAVVTLALAIGAVTAVFSVVNGVLLDPLPYEDPERVVMVGETDPGEASRPSPGRTTGTGRGATSSNRWRSTSATACPSSAKASPNASAASS